MNKSQLRLLSAMSAFAIASTGVVAPLSTLPSAEAFNNIGTSQDLLIVHSEVTAQGHKITLNNEDFKNISEGVQVQTFLDNDLYVMIDQLVVNTADMVAQYGFDYKVEFHFNYNETGFSFQTYVVSGSMKEALEIDSSVGIIVQIPQSMYDSNENSQLFFGSQRAEQLNDDGIIYAVLYESGSYKVTNDGSVPTATYSQEVVTSVPDFYQTSQPDYGVKDTENDDIVVVYNAPAKEDASKAVAYENLGRDETDHDTTEFVEDAGAEDNRDIGTTPAKGNIKVKTQDGYRDETDIVQVIKDATGKNKDNGKDSTMEGLNNTQSTTWVSAENTTSLNNKQATTIKEDTTPKGIYVEEEIVAKKSFKDVDGLAYKNEINALADKGIIMGYSSSIFMPQEEITRGHFSAILVRALGLNVTESTTSKFEDTNNKWYTGAVNALTEKGYVIGTTTKTFSPENSITKQQVSMVIFRILEDFGATAGIQAEKFTDMHKVLPYAEESIGVLKAMNVLQADEEGAFNPLETSSRGETASMIYRMAKILEKF